MHPGARAGCDGHDARERIEGACVHLAGLKAQDRAGIQLRKLRRVDAAEWIDRCWYDVAEPEAQDAQRLGDGNVYGGGRNDAHGRRPRCPIHVPIPSIPR